MSISERLKAKIDQKIIENLGIDVTFLKKTQIYYNSRGEQLDEEFDEQTVRIVVYNFTSSQRDDVPFGEIEAGDLVAIVSSDVEVGIGDKLVISSKQWKVEAIEPHLVQQLNVGWILRLVPVQA